MDWSNVNFLGIIIATVAGMASGAAWYGIFAKPWMNAAGLTEADIEQKPSLYVVAGLVQLIIATIMSVLFAHFGSISIGGSIMAAFFLWLGFCVAPMAVNHRFQGKGWDLTIIDGGFWLVVFVLQALIIGYMMG